MKSGELRHYITIRRNTAPRDDMGGQGPAVWTDVVSCFASIEPIVGREWHESQSDQSGVTHTIKIRYTDQILTTDQIFDEQSGVIYEIVAIMNIDTRNRELRINARTGVASNG